MEYFWLLKFWCITSSLLCFCTSNLGEILLIWGTFRIWPKQHILTGWITFLSTKTAFTSSKNILGPIWLCLTSLSPPAGRPAGLVRCRAGSSQPSGRSWRVALSNLHTRAWVCHQSALWRASQTTDTPSPILTDGTWQLEDSTSNGQKQIQDQPITQHQLHRATHRGQQHSTWKQKQTTTSQDKKSHN